MSRDEAPRWPDPGWTDAATGRRVSVRVGLGRPGPSGGPAYRDVLGILERADASSWVIRVGADTSLVSPRDVVAAVIVPEQPPRRQRAADVDVATLELIAAQGWQGLDQHRIGDWLLRAAGGFTGRANSALPIGDPGMPLSQALAAVAAWYRERALTPQIQVPLPLAVELDAELADHGWSPGTAVDVMVTDLALLRMAAPSRAAPPATVSGGVTLDVATAPDAAWLATFRYGGQTLPASLTAVMTKAEHPVFVSARDEGGSTVAIARGAITPRWLGITAVEVVAHRRRQGLGHSLIAALADYAAPYQARHVYLQVAEENEPARRLYLQLGFVCHHSYRYRRLDEPA